MQLKNKEIGLYVHIPFCKAKCYYCDFNSFSGSDELIPAYFNSLKKEINLYKNKLANFDIKTVFIGGGTPSFVDTSYIYEVLNLCRQNFNILEDAEISIETNPGTLSYEKLRAYKAMGINRLSMGLQAWQNSLLKKIGRIHNSEEFLDNFKQARKAGFKNINVDLIFGLPGQTMKDWEETLDNIIKLKLEHVSCYSLKIEEGTVFGERLKKGELSEAEDELDRQMYYMAKEKFAQAGLKQYEISNFAKAGYECRHNLVYWKAEEYLGVGAGAHSYLEDSRFNNIVPIKKYISGLSNGFQVVENTEFISKVDSISEFMILGLRLIQGINAKEFKKRYNEDIFELFGEKITKLLGLGLINQDGDRIFLCSKGLDVANQVFIEFI